ncbi:hypothetical protein, partial [Mycobacterium intermedium]|uniref:hypothetical protein n=1 Tax=Mycobacterium intermedium TaxID=28445 RepID=UPI001B808A8A
KPHKPQTPRTPSPSPTEITLDEKSRLSALQSKPIPVAFALGFAMLPLASRPAAPARTAAIMDAVNGLDESAPTTRVRVGRRPTGAFLMSSGISHA